MAKDISTEIRTAYRNHQGRTRECRYLIWKSHGALPWRLVNLNIGAHLGAFKTAENARKGLDRHIEILGETITLVKEH